MYGPLNGLFLLAWSDYEISGGVGLRTLEGAVSEMKRLFVYNQFSGQGVGRILCTELIAKAQKLGYEKMLRYERSYEPL
jgi:N-acetylglutamate synthase-like GNAT family acetyltransferase